MPDGEDSFMQEAIFGDLYKNTLDNNILILDEGGNILKTNHAFRHRFGYGDEVIGQNFAVLFTPQDQEKGLPQSEIKTVLQKTRAGDHNFLMANDGVRTWVSGESILTELQGERRILKIFQDIQTQKKSEESIVELEDQNQEILKSINDAVIIIDEDLKIVKANTSFYQLFSRKTSDIPHNLEEILKPYEVTRDLLLKISNAFEEGRGFEETIIDFKANNGVERTYGINGTFLGHLNNQPNLLIVVHDISIHKQMEKEREDLIGFVAHELRNPLSNLVLCNTLMEDALEDSNGVDMKDMLERSKKNIDRMTKMITELYRSATITSGNIKMDITSFPFNEMVEEALKQMRDLHPDFRIIIKGDIPAKIQGDRHKLVEVITNYLANAIKYSQENKEILIEMESNHSEVILGVIDQGLGISRQQLPYIFDRFFRANRNNKIEGLGLGLFLCKRIIQAHKGKVWAQSVEGSGSSFYFSLPIS